MCVQHTEDGPSILSEAGVSPLRSNSVGTPNRILKSCINEEEKKDHGDPAPLPATELPPPPKSEGDPMSATLLFCEIEAKCQLMADANKICLNLVPIPCTSFKRQI